MFSTVHANDAINTITRLLDIGIPPFLLGSCVNLIVAQRLIRTICPNCKEEYTPTQTELDLIQFPKDKISSTTFYTGKGCSKCRYTGYKGRTAIDEILEVKQNIRSLIFESSNEEQIKVEALNNGMTHFVRQVLKKLKRELQQFKK